MTLDALKKHINDKLDISETAEYMKGCELMLLTMATALWTIEKGYEKERYRETVYDFINTLQRINYYHTQGARYTELFNYALANEAKPVEAFLNRAIPLALQQNDFTTLDKYKSLTAKKD